MTELVLIRSEPYPQQRLTWIITAAIFVVALLWCAADGISFSFRLLGGFLVVYTILVLVAEICRITPLIAPLSVSIDGLAQLWMAAAGLAIIQYPLARLSFPLVDSQLVTFDRVLGFNWEAHFAWVSAHELVMQILEGIYKSYPIMAPLFVLSVGLYRPTRLRECLLANVIAALICAALAAVFPALGAAGYFLSRGQWPDYVASFELARAGLLPLDLGHISGIEQFPSYHAVMAVIYAYGFLALPRIISYPMLALQFILMVSALSIGGHHLADLISGTAITIGVIAAIRWRLRNPNPQSEEIAKSQNRLMAILVVLAQSALVRAILGRTAN